MRLVDTVCPHCGAVLFVSDRKRTVDCGYCGNRFSVGDGRRQGTYAENAARGDPEFRKLFKIVSTDDPGRVQELRDELFDSHPEDPHGWLLNGYMALTDCSDSEDQWRLCISSWRRALALIDSERSLDAASR